ncbi:hypothetical protein N798_16695 [Knoellia flava TL1]|uniref:Uncharacterized protein n=1 Tax=Knoellia flava TL1 TaxID=1385518 RepID=A0ABR4X9N1_9MICO|nr:hypothetical protein N798_16695 [Knoellia flava TL1]
MAFFSTLAFTPSFADILVALQGALSGVNGFCVVCW